MTMYEMTLNTYYYIKNIYITIFYKTYFIYKMIYISFQRKSTWKAYSVGSGNIHSEDALKKLWKS